MVQVKHNGPKFYQKISKLTKISKFRSQPPLKPLYPESALFQNSCFKPFLERNFFVPRQNRPLLTLTPLCYTIIGKLCIWRIRKEVNFQHRFKRPRLQQDHQRWGYSTVERFKKKLNKDKRKEQRTNYTLIWGGSSCVSIFFMSAFAPSALRLCECRIYRCYEGFGLLLTLY